MTEVYRPDTCGGWGRMERKGVSWAVGSRHRGASCRCWDCQGQVFCPGGQMGGYLAGTAVMVTQRAFE